jgi:hypothetical protein
VFDSTAMVDSGGPNPVGPVWVGVVVLNYAPGGGAR